MDLTQDNQDDLNKIGMNYYANKDYANALKYTKLCADVGNLEALCGLGVLYYYGEGVVQDYTKAVECFQSGVEKKHARSMHCLGRCYHDGNGVPQNYHKAIECIQLSIDNGYLQGYLDLGISYESIRNYTKAIECYQSDMTDAHCLVNLGALYYNGNGVPQNYEKAVEYFLLANTKSIPSLTNNLGVCYLHGNGIAKDLKKALELLTKPVLIKKCELELLSELNKSLTRQDYIYAYPLYVKHKYCGLEQLKRLLNSEYLTAFKFMPKVLAKFITSFLI